MKTYVHFLSYLAHLFLEWEMLQTKVVEKNKTHILRLITLLSKKIPCMRQGRKILYSRAEHTWQYSICTLHARYPRLQTHTQNMQHLMLFHFNDGCTNAPESYI